MPYHILSIAPTSFFADYGCHVRILEEIRALQQLGHQVTLCTYHTGDPVPGIRIVRMPRLPWQRRVRIGSHWHKPYFDLLLTATALVTAVRQRVDVVHAHLHEGALIGAVVARLLRCPLVFDYQGSLTGRCSTMASWRRVVRCSGSSGVWSGGLMAYPTSSSPARSRRRRNWRRRAGRTGRYSHSPMPWTRAFFGPGPRMTPR